MSRFSDSRGYIGSKGLQEFLHRLSSTLESPLKRSDVSILTNSFLNNATELHISEILARLSDEVGRFEWVSISKRFKNAVQQATLAGINLSKLFSDVDRKNTGTISIQDLHVVLQSLASFVKFTVSEIDVIAKYCSSIENAMVSIKSIMSLVNLEYAGSNRSHLIEFLHTNLHKKFDDAFIEVISKRHMDPHKDLLDTEFIEGILSELGVLNHFARSQIRSLVVDIMNDRTTLTGDQFLTDFKTQSYSSSDHSDSVDLESLLRTLLNKAIDKGVDIVATFRYFDCDGNGSISKKELESGISKLGISSSISNWKLQLPKFISRFDSSGDGSVSLKEFFSFFGIKDYTPNIIQKMTKTFALANDKGVSVCDSFDELDTSSCGSITPSELQLGLKKFGIQSDISLDDFDLIVSQLNQNGDGDKKISRKDFVTFFENRISQVNEEKRRSKTDKLIQRFCSLMKLSVEKGLTLDSIFKHFDVSGDGNLVESEFSNALRSIPHFSSLNSEDLKDLFCSIDHDANGHISIAELKQVVMQASVEKVKIETTPVPDSSSDSLSIRSRFCMELCRIAEPDGGLVGLLAYLDRDGDGLISCESFFRILSREGVYDVVDKSSCVSILRPLISNENINVALLLRFVEDSDFDPERDSLIAKDKLKLEIESSEQNHDYEFSTNPEIRQVEKKLRSVGRILSCSGSDVESLFKKYDARNSGMIRKSDFIDMLSKSGLYILEKGDPVEVVAPDTVSEKQKLQVQKLRDSPGRFQTRLRHNSISFAPDSKSIEEFEDHTAHISLINWHRQSQKRLLLQRILSHSLSISVNIFPR
jgi:Ca2+-binding EF-hand superfamily protein